MLVTLYQKPGCHLCEDVLDILDRLIPQYGLEVKQVNILDNIATYQAYREQIPVIEAEDGRFGRLVAPIDEPELRAYLDMVRNALSPIPAVPQARHTPSHVGETGADRVAGFIARHWLSFICITLGIFVGIAWSSAIFAALGWWDVANVIYTAYALTCHQLPERAGSILGYQVAFCFRNTALYAGLLMFGMMYGLARDRNVPFLRRLRTPIPWWALVLLLLPMFLDGVTHMFGMRDSMADMAMEPEFGSFFIGSQVGSLNWLLRVVTALMAALGAAWFAFPRMDGTLRQSEAMRLMYKQHAYAASRQSSIRVEQPAASESRAVSS
jgi:uncharacterized membrane protein/glutaredoxin